jgi:hypothetical protein
LILLYCTPNVAQAANNTTYPPFSHTVLNQVFELEQGAGLVPVVEAAAALQVELGSCGVPFSQLVLDQVRASGRLAAALAESRLLAEAVAAVQAELADMPAGDPAEQDKVRFGAEAPELGLALLLNRDSRCGHGLRFLLFWQCLLSPQALLLAPAPAGAAGHCCAEVRRARPSADCPRQRGCRCSWGPPGNN